MTRTRAWAAVAAISVVGTLSACAPGVDEAASPTPSPTPTQTGFETGAGFVSGELRGGLAWSDEFEWPDGHFVDETRWLPVEWPEGEVNDELQAYTARTENLVHDGNGALRIIAREEDYSHRGIVGDFTSGRIESMQSFRYGLIEARIKVPEGTGLWPAFWLLGNFGDTLEWPAVGEIDIMELVGDTRNLYATVHGGTADDDIWRRQEIFESEVPWTADWHVYAVDWSSDALVFSVDGEEFFTVYRDDLEDWEDWPFDRSSHIILNVAVGGQWPARPTDSSVFPAEMLVDYVRVYDSEVYLEGDFPQDQEQRDEEEDDEG